MVRQPRIALLAAFVCASGLAITGIVALGSPVAQAHDAGLLAQFTALNRPWLEGLANVISHLADPIGYLLFAIAFVVVALRRGRPRTAVATLVAMIAAAPSAELLKPLLASPRSSDWLATGTNIPAGSWPSGHATAAMAIALCAVLVAPRRLRPLVAVAGTALAVGVAYSILMLGWHFPSDVLGGYLLAGAWVALAVAALWWSERRWPARTGRRAIARATTDLAPGPGTQRALALTVTVLAALAAAAILLRGGAIAAYTALHPAFVAGALAIAALAATLAAALTVALRRS